MAPVPKDLEKPEVPYLKKLQAYIDNENKKTPADQALLAACEDAKKILPENVKVVKEYHEAVKEMVTLKYKLIPGYDLDKPDFNILTEEQVSKLDALKTRAQNLPEAERKAVLANISKLEKLSESMVEIKDRTVEALTNSGEKKLDDTLGRADYAATVLRHAMVEAAMKDAKDAIPKEEHVKIMTQKLKYLETELKEAIEKEKKLKGMDDDPDIQANNLPENVKELAKKAMQQTHGGTSVPRVAVTNDGKGQHQI